MMTACASSCDQEASHVTAIGELNNGEFGFRCVGETDPHCAATDASQQFPDCILLGGRFDLDYDLRDNSALFDSDDAQLLHVASASETYFSSPLPSVALRVGRAAMLARTDDNVVDIIHFDIVAPDRIEIRDAFNQQWVDQVAVAADDVAVVSIVGGTNACLAPGGALPLDVYSSNNLIAIADVTGTDVRIAGLQEGSATLTIALGTLRRDVMVVVGPAESDTGSIGGTGGETSAAGTSGSDEGVTSGYGSGDSSGDSSGGTTGAGGTSTGGTTGGSSTGGM